MVIKKDLFFAGVNGLKHENYHLDLYLPHIRDSTETPEKITERAYQHTNKENKYDSETSKHSHFQYIQQRQQNECALKENEQENGKELHDTSNGQCVDHSNTDTDKSRSRLNRKRVVPMVIFVHGGGWRRGDKNGWKHFLYFDVNLFMVLMQFIFRTYSNVGHTLSENGIACAVISYPLTEAGTLCLLIEQLLSYVQSCVALFIFSIPLILFALFSRLAFSSQSLGSWEILFNEQKHWPLLKESLLVIMLVTNIVTMILFSARRSDYKLSILKIRAKWMVVFALLLMSTYFQSYRLLFLVISTLTLNQLIILKRRLSRTNTTYKEQVGVVAKAVKWAKQYGTESGAFDINNLYMMGHSAGGHLASLSVLDDSILKNEGCSSQDIKGVISLSGVYNLTCLQGRWLRPFYLAPTFGHCKNTWNDASPTHLAKRLSKRRHQHKFLLLCAERDLFLKPQSIEFAKLLQDSGIYCRHFEIRGTNHFSIVTRLKRYIKEADCEVLLHINNFINA